MFRLQARNNDILIQWLVRIQMPWEEEDDYGNSGEASVMVGV